jgi:hypothetical protein
MNPIVPFGEKQVHFDTRIFRSQTQKVISLTQTVIPFLCNFLNWPQRATRLLTTLVIFLGDDSSPVEIRHKEVGELLYPSKSISGREGAVKQALRDLRDSQALSGFQAVRVRGGSGKRLPGGGYKGIPTTYQMHQLYSVYGDIQCAAYECDLLSLPNGRCQMKLMGIIGDVCRERGYVQAIRGKDVAEPKSHSCADPDCTLCPIHCDAAMRAESETISEGYVLERMMRMPLDERHQFVLNLTSLMMAAQIPEYEEHREAATFVEKMKLNIDQADKLWMMERRRRVLKFNRR